MLRPLVALFVMVGVAWLAVCATIVWRSLPFALSVTVVPNTGVSFGDLDQAATAVAGAVTLVNTVSDTTGETPKIASLKRW